MPLVSILIPAIRATWLNEAIQSALAQTFADVEVIISDDSPDDKIEKTVSALRDPRIKYFKNPTQGKPGTNRDFIIRQAQGEYIKHLFDDDFLYPHSVDMLLGMLRGGNCKLAFHSRHIVDADSRIIGQPRFRITPGNHDLLAKFAFEIRREYSRYRKQNENSYGPRDFCAVPPDYFFERVIGEASNPIGEPSNILFHAPTFHEMKDPYMVAGNRMRFLTDVALYTSFAAHGHGIIGTAKIASAYRKHGQQTSSRAYPGYSAGLFEWELIARWAVDTGNLSLEKFSAMRLRLLPRYRQQAEKYAELNGFINLPEATPGTPLLDDQFRQTLSNAYDAIDRRKVQVHGAGVC